MALKDLAPRWAKDVANVTTRQYAVSTARWRPWPDFLLIGTKRGGTTSLFNYLLRHPGILGMFPQARRLKSPAYFFEKFRLGEGWYRSHFHTSSYRSVVARRLGYRPLSGESSPYYLYDPRIAARVANAMPSVKVIVLLRHPVKRAFSQYQDNVKNGLDPLSFEDALEAEPTRVAGELERMEADPYYYGFAHDFFSYRDRGVYLPQLERWYSALPAEQLLVLPSESFYADEQAVFDQACAFLGLPAYQLPRKERRNHIPAPKMNDATWRSLSEFYAPHNAALAQRFGAEYSWA
jgi:Sulfotransferase family